jgi:hypothetical protein
VGEGESRLACETPRKSSTSAEARLERSLEFLSHAAVSTGERRALRIAEAGAASSEELRAVWLSRARLAEMEGSYPLGLAALARAETRQRDAVVHYDRVVLLALAGRRPERDAAVCELGSLLPRDRQRCRSWALADKGPFGLRLLAEPELRQDLLARLA